MNKELNRYLPKDVRMANKHMKNGQHPWSSVKCKSTPSNTPGKAKIKRTDVSVDEDVCGEIGVLRPCR